MRLEPFAPSSLLPTRLNAPRIDIGTAQMYIYEGSLQVERSHKIPTLANEVEVQALVSRSLNSKSTDVLELKFPNPSLTHSISGCVFEAPSHMV